LNAALAALRGPNAVIVIGVVECAPVFVAGLNAV
jgi:hypothetical protein